MQYARYTPVVQAVVLAIGAIGFAAPALAQTADTNATANATDKTEAASTTLETVTVIGSVNDLQSLDFYAPNSSAVLQKDQIDALGARKLDQALQYQAGVVSEPFGADNKVEWFKIRGFDASVSLDGTPPRPMVTLSGSLKSLAWKRWKWSRAPTR
ncbi:TonB-dependent receptor plug domain-containing protein [Comamonas sp. JC664]|uniref:TonB-dependent receptor plug domain-containing protein n=1 Tax=Comamonas sp. JC664 TaxID=2801917 RepID=UPI003609A5A0